ncbi:hypothetical protein EG68_04051 [Paragonimus skrjabini miyazakii]|uniref:Uncharacterized protein n=1 Tax=Paragonimus skrjabini miyazakii TaxID=59628 RepID=A0A8S9YZY2_9TREM|nr:hypothetical protein EG68_04051 [Paragonimus skrjabini miyazakii]
MEQPKNPLEYIKKRLVDVQPKVRNTCMHYEVFAWPHHPLLRCSKDLVSDVIHQSDVARLLHRIKAIETKYLECTEQQAMLCANAIEEKSVFHLTELAFS